MDPSQHKAPGLQTAGSASSGSRAYIRLLFILDERWGKSCPKLLVWIKIALGYKHRRTGVTVARTRQSEAKCLLFKEFRRQLVQIYYSSSVALRDLGSSIPAVTNRWATDPRWSSRSERLATTVLGHTLAKVTGMCEGLIPCFHQVWTRRPPSPNATYPSGRDSAVSVTTQAPLGACSWRGLGGGRASRGSGPLWWRQALVGRRAQSCGRETALRYMSRFQGGAAAGRRAEALLHLPASVGVAEGPPVSCRGQSKPGSRGLAGGGGCRFWLL